MTDLKHLHIDTSQSWITFYHFQIWCYIITIIIELSHWFQRNPIFNCRLYSITTSLIICLMKGRVRIVNIDIMYKNVQHSGPYKVFCRKKPPWWNWCPPEHKVLFLHVKQSSLNKIWCSYRRYVVIWNNSKNPTRCSTSGRGEDFGTWGTVFGSFGSQNVYLNALNPLAHLVIFLTCTLQMKNAELLGLLPTPLTSWPGAKQVNLGTTVIFT